MTAPEYAARRAAGICAADSCTELATHGRLCLRHRTRQRKASRKAERAAYLRKKLAGVCVGHGCNEPAVDSPYCNACKAVVAARQARRLATAEGREKHKEAQARRRKKRSALGLCMRCNKPRVTKRLCEGHRVAAIEAWRRRTGAAPNPRFRCSACERKGHRADRCPGLPALPPLRIEDFASARTAA